MRLRTMLIATLVLVPLVGAGTFVGIQRLRHGDPMAKAEASAAAGDLRGAQIELRAALQNQPDNAEAHLRMAKLQMKLADAVAAEKEFRRAIALGADQSVVVPLLGEALLAQGREPEVLRLPLLRTASPEQRTKLLLLRAIAQLTANDVAAASETYATAKQLAPDSADTGLIAARLAAARNDEAQTEADLTKVLKAKPDDVEALLMEAQILSLRSDPAALQFADRAVAAAPWSAKARIDRAYQYMVAGRDADARKDVEAVLANQPRFIDAIYLKGILMAREGRFADASVQLAQLDGVGARFPQAVFYQGRVAQELGQKEAAAELARRYNRLIPRDPDGVRLLGQTALATNQAAAALPTVEKAVQQGQSDANMLDLLGRLLIATSQPQAAVAAFQKADAAAPKDAAILRDLGAAQIQLGQADEALKSLDSALQIDPKSQAAMALLVQASLDAGDTAGAATALDNLRAAAGPTEEVNTLAGLLDLQRNDADGARAAWTAVLKTNPAAAGARINLTKLLLREGRSLDAHQLLLPLLAKEPANRLAVTLDAMILSRANDLPATLALLQAAHTAAPSDISFTAMLADTQTLSGKPAAAVEMLTRMQTAAPLPDALLLPLARAQSAAGQAADATATYQAATKARPADPVAWAGLIAQLQSGGNVQAVTTALRQRVEANPGDLLAMTNLVTYENAKKGTSAALQTADALRAIPANMPFAAFLRGDLLMRLNRPAEAAQAYQTEYAATPTPQLLLRLATAQSASGHDDDATSALRTWLREHKMTDDGSVDAARTLAQLDMRAKRYGDALDHLGLVLQARPNDPQALNNLAWTYHLVGDPRARAAAQAAYLKTPSTDAADTLGWIMTTEGAATAALPLLRDALRRRPDDQNIRYHLAVALTEDGQAGEAAPLLQQLAEAVPSLCRARIRPEDAAKSAAHPAIDCRQAISPGG